MNYITLNNGVKMPQLGYGVYATHMGSTPPRPPLPRMAAAS